MASPDVRVYAYRNKSKSYTVENPDVFPLEPITIEAGQGFSVFVRADTTVGPKWVAVRINADPWRDNLISHIVSRLAYPLVRAEIPRLDPKEIDRRLKDDHERFGDISTWIDEHRNRVQARERQYVEAIKPRLTNALTAA